jgi:hypothetical protein
MRASMFATISVVLLAGAASAASNHLGRGMELAPHMRNPASGDPVASLYRHVALVTDGQGRTERLWLAANHTFLWQGPMGERGHGLWSLKGDRICLSALTEADPAGRPRERKTPAAARCAEFRPGHSAGDTWSQHNDRGELVSVHVQ